MKIMLSQPMAGKTNQQIKKEREEIVKKLEQQGHEVVNTVFENFEEGKNTPLHYLAKSIEFLANVDCLVCMQGWKEARGCRIEEKCAKEYGKFIKYE